MHKFLRLSVFAALAAVAANAAVTFDFTSSGGTTGGTTPFGNLRTYTSGAYSVTVSSFSLPSDLSGNFVKAQLNQYSGLGLASCNQVEGANCGDPTHQVDNSGSFDFVLFTFNFLTDPVSVVINPYGTYDKDVTYWVGNTSANLSTLAFAGLGMGPRIDDDDSSNPLNTNSRTVLLGGGYGNSLLLASRLSGNGADGNADYFKIESLTVNAAVPEPATFGMAGLALVGLGLLRKRVSKS